MTCPNCGAFIKDDALECEYCGYENERIAKKLQDSEISGIYARLAAKLHLPEKVLKKITRWLLIGVGGMIAVFLVGLLISFIISAVGPKAAYNRQQSRIEKLEAFYTEGDYAALAQAYEKMDFPYGAAFEKYDIIYRMQDNIEFITENMEETVGLIKDLPEAADLFSYDMDDLFNILNTCEDLKAAGYVYGEQAAAEHFAARALIILKEDMFLTDAAIARGREIALEEEPDYSALYTISGERIRGESK